MGNSMRDSLNTQAGFEKLVFDKQWPKMPAVRCHSKFSIAILTVHSKHTVYTQLAINLYVAVRLPACNDLMGGA